MFYLERTTTIRRQNTMANGHIIPCYHNHRYHYKVRQSIYIVTMHKIVKLKQISSNETAYRFRYSGTETHIHIAIYRHRYAHAHIAYCSKGNGAKWQSVWCGWFAYLLACLLPFFSWVCTQFFFRVSTSTAEMCVANREYMHTRRASSALRIISLRTENI